MPTVEHSGLIGVSVVAFLLRPSFSLMPLTSHSHSNLFKFNCSAAGCMCKICHETGRRAFPKMKREELVQSMEDPVFKDEFTESLFPQYEAFSHTPTRLRHMNHVDSCRFTHCDTATSSRLLSHSSGRKLYVQELHDKVSTGSNRLKKRSKTIKKAEQTSVSSKVKGTFWELDAYKAVSWLSSQQVKCTCNLLLCQLSMTVTRLDWTRLDCCQCQC